MDSEKVARLARLLMTKEGKERASLKGRGVRGQWVLVRTIKESDAGKAEKSLIHTLTQATGSAVLAGLVVAHGPDASPLEPGTGVLFFPAGLSKVGEDYGYVEDKVILDTFDVDAVLEEQPNE